MVGMWPRGVSGGNSHIMGLHRHWNTEAKVLDWQGTSAHKGKPRLSMRTKRSTGVCFCASLKLKSEIPARLFRTTVLMLAVCSLCAAQERTLWQDPGEIEHINFTHAAGPENPSRPPFHFVRERLS